MKYILEKWDMKVIINYINAFLIVTVGLWLSVTCDVQVSGPRRFASVVGKLNWRRTDEWTDDTRGRSEGAIAARAEDQLRKEVIMEFDRPSGSHFDPYLAWLKDNRAPISKIALWL